MVKMTEGYGLKDKDYLDYEIVDPQEIDSRFGTQTRSRLPSTTKNPKIVFLGAAQTFGRFAKEPFPTILQKKLDIPILSITRMGCSPEFWTNQIELIDMINNADVLIYQITSARATSTSLFRSEAGGRHGIREKDGKRMDARDFLQSLIEEDQASAFPYIEELRQKYLDDTRSFLDQISVPKVALWISKRQPDYAGARLPNPIMKKFMSLKSRLGVKRGIDAKLLMGDYPHYVNEDMMTQISAMVSDVVFCVSQSGLPQVLKSRSGSGQVRKNLYYPTPEMHIEAAEALLPFCLKYLSQKG